MGLKLRVNYKYPNKSNKLICGRFEDGLNAT